MSTAAPKRATGRALKRRLRPPKPSWPSWKEKVSNGVTKLPRILVSYCFFSYLHRPIDTLIGYHRDLSYFWWWNTNHKSQRNLKVVPIDPGIYITRSLSYFRAIKSANFLILLEKVIIEACPPQSSPLPQHLAWPPISMPQECKPPAVTAIDGPRPDGSAPSHHQGMGFLYVEVVRWFTTKPTMLGFMTTAC